MNIVVNAVLAFEQPRGVGKYLNTRFRTLAQIDKDNQYYIYYGKWMKNYDVLKIRQPNFHFIELDIKNNIVSRNLYLALGLPLECRKYKPDVFFLIDSQAIMIKPCKMVSTIHDLAEFTIPEKYSRTQAFIRRQIVRHQVKASDHILTVSQFSRNDICSRFHVKPEKITVTYNTIGLPGTRQLQKPEKYFLYVSEIERAKNPATLIKAYALLPEDIRNSWQLYIVGKKGNDYDNVMNLIRENKIEDRVRIFGYVSDEELETLYARAWCFIFPSVFEGFGFPVLEAMAKGTPVICSDSSSIPEVGGDAVLLFDPYDEKMLASQMCKLVREDGLRDCMIQKGLERAKQFDETAAARQTLEVLINTGR